MWINQKEDILDSLSNGKKWHTVQVYRIFRQNNFSEGSIRKIRLFFEREKDIVEFLNSMIDEWLEKETLERHIIWYIDLCNAMLETKSCAQNLI